MASDLGLYCVPMAQKKALGLYGLEFFLTYFFPILNTSRFSVKQNKIENNNNNNGMYFCKS